MALSNGSPFGPVLQRQLVYTHRSDISPTVSWLPDVLQRQSSEIIRNEGQWFVS